MKFVQFTVKRFIPGEKVEDAIQSTKELIKHNIPTTFTHLGENISNLKGAEVNTKHYLDLLEKIKSENLDIEISLKLTQNGFDLSFDKTLDLFFKISEKAKSLNNNVFIDIVDSSYVDKTIHFYKKIKDKQDNVGLCLQAYLYRTMADVKEMIELNPWIRLVRGAYKETASVAFLKLSKVNENFIFLSKYLLEQVKAKGLRMVF